MFKSNNSTIHTNNNIDADCEIIQNIRPTTWFVLPPIWEFYYKNHHPEYQSLPEFKPDCQTAVKQKSVKIIYPESGQVIHLPKKLDERTADFVIEAYNAIPGSHVYWHLNGNYCGQTESIHQISLQPGPGLHKLFIVNASGDCDSLVFRIR